MIRIFVDADACPVEEEIGRVARRHGLEVTLVANLSFAPIMAFIGMIAMSIGGIGVREGLSIFFFTMLPGMSKEQLLAHAGYGYILMVGMALVNLLLAFAVLRKPGNRPGDGR